MNALHEWIQAGAVSESFAKKHRLVELIRCKDCKYWQDNNNGYPHEECRWGHDETPDPYDYCSFGEKVVKTNARH